MMRVKSKLFFNLFFIVALGLTLSLTACKTKMATEPVPAEEAIALQKKLRSLPNFDLSSVKVVKFQYEGDPLDVTSLAPQILSTEQHEGQMYVTALWLSEDRETLHLFTRNPATGDGETARIALNDLAEGKSISFPVLKDGDLESKDFTLIKIVTK